MYAKMKEIDPVGGVHAGGAPLDPPMITFVHIFKTSQFIVYRMGRLCGGAHEISGIKAPIFLHGWVGVVGWVV